MRRIAVSFLLFALISCQKGAPSAPKVEAPADVILTVSANHAGALATRLGRYVDAIAPGMGGQLNGKAVAEIVSHLVGAPSLDGLDLEQPLRIIVFNPKTHPDHPVVLLGSFPDAEKLRRGVGDLKVEREDGHALVGAEAEIAAARAWAFGTLATTPAPEAVTAEVWLDRVLAAYRPSIEGFAKQMSALGMGSMQAVLEAEIQVFLAIGDQSERLFVAFDSTGDDASLDVALVPKAGTTLAAFVAAQKPFDPKALASLPAFERPAMVLVGHSELGALSEPLYRLAGPFLAQVAGRPFDDAFHKLWTEWLGHFTGDYAAVSAIEPTGGTAMSEILGVDDGPAAQKLVESFFASQSGEKKASVMGMELTFTSAIGAAQHGPVSIDTFSVIFDTSKMPALQQEMFKKMYPDGMKMAFAGWGKTLGITLGSKAVDALGQLIDSVNAPGKAPLPANVTTMIEASAKSKDSGAFVMNMAAMMNPMGTAPPAQSAMTWTFSFADARAHLRMALPAKHVGEVMGAVKSSGLRQR